MEKKMILSQYAIFANEMTYKQQGVAENAN